MAQEIILNVEATTAEAVRNLEVLNNTIEEQKQILVELEKELFRVETAQKQTSKTNLAAQTQLRQEADHLKNSIKDQRLALKDLNLQQAQTKSALDSVHTSSQRVSTSFQDVAANGGAIAILDALTGGLASRMRDAFEATKLFNLSLKGTKTALIATGVGAFAVVLGTVVAYWDDIVAFIKGANDELKNSIALNQKNLTEIDHQVSQLELQKQILEANGQSTKGINKDIEEAILLRQEENRQLTENLKKQLEIEQAEVRKTTFLEDAEISIYRALGLTERMAKAQAEAVIGTDEQRQKLEELNQEIRDSETKQLEFEAKLANLRKQERDKEAEEIKKRREEDGIMAVGFNKNAALKEVDERQEILNAKLKQEAEYTENLRGFANARKEIEQAELQNKIAIIQAEQSAREANLQTIANGLNGLQQVFAAFGKESKALAIASIIVDQVSSISRIVSNTGIANAQALAISPLTFGQPWVTINTISAAASIAGSIASAGKSIAALKGNKKTPLTASMPSAPSGGGGGGGGGITAPSAAPQFNIIGAGGTNQLAGLLADQSSQPIKAYVVSNEVSTAQSLDRNIVESATLG